MLVLRTADLAGINFSLILNLYSLTPFLTAILFYLVFKEKLAKVHLLGMIFIFACVVVTGESNSEQEVKPGQLSVLVPLFLALSATIFFTLTNFSSRYFVEKGCLSSAQLLADSCIV
jgi:drug/metabolite transporter (DMT)-like permease